MSMLEVNNLSVCYGNVDILNNISFSLKENQWMMIVGPNGAGKSTVINAVSQGVPYKGSVSFFGNDIKMLRPSELAKYIGVLTQNHYVGYPFTVEEVVKLGRYAYSTGIFSTMSEEDYERINNAIEITGMQPFRNQPVPTLSGGELQRTFLAQVFAQDPKLLILDEPTNHLDLVYQKQMFELIGEWIKQDGRAVISVVHDLSLAKAYGTDAVLMNKGSIILSGRISDVLTAEHLQSVYSMDVYGWMKTMLSQWEQ